MKKSEKLYDVSQLTMALLPEFVDKNEEQVRTRVIEKEEQFISQESPLELMDRACRFFGSSLEGRQIGVKEMCGYTHKAPIAVDPVGGMYFFPTNSPRSLNCGWISHSSVRNVEKAPLQQTKITFVTGFSIVLDVSFSTIINQIQRTAQFRYQFNERVHPYWYDRNNRIAEPSLTFHR